MKPHWLYRPETIRRLWHIGLAILALMLAAQWVFPIPAHFDIASIFGFDALFGFIACVALILFSLLLGAFIKRPEDYYDD